MVRRKRVAQRVIVLADGLLECFYFVGFALGALYGFRDGQSFLSQTELYAICAPSWI